jgi:S-(hydroxymethyl)glutathione dehydrogenase / alcohol dehydrogenase
MGCIYSMPLWSQCDRSNPKGELGASFGYTQVLGGYDGGQAEYVRVPFANTVAALKVPESIKTDEQVLFLSDIIPTGYFGADIANVQPGDDVAVFDAGPVGYFAVMSSFLCGAAYTCNNNQKIIQIVRKWYRYLRR